MRYLIAKCPGRTEIEITRAIYGQDARVSRVNLVCHKLVNEGLVKREGRGRVDSPYRYWPSEPK